MFADAVNIRVFALLSLDEPCRVFPFLFSLYGNDFEAP